MTNEELAGLISGQNATLDVYKRSITKLVGDKMRMLDALKAARAILADEPQQGGKTWTLKAIREAIALAEKDD
jgi:hypothetical protein